MNVFGKLFGRKPQPIEDTVFGRIEFGLGGWTRLPKEESNGFIVIIVAPESGPTDCQRDFYKKLSLSLDETIADAKRLVQVSAADVDVGALSLYSVEIGPDAELASDDFVIELSDKDQNQIHVVNFVNGKPSVYGCDD